MYAKGHAKGTAKFAVKPANDAKDVMISGDFSNWKPVSMKRQRDGSFAVEVPIATPTCQYKFIVDGKWMVDPDNSVWAANPFGTVNSVARL